MERSSHDQPFYDYAWVQLVTQLLWARRQIFRSLGSMRGDSAVRTAPAHLPRASLASLCDIAALSSFVHQPIWQATWSRAFARIATALMEQDLPELYMDLPASASELIERWHSRWLDTQVPTFLHVYPKSMDTHNTGDRFLPELGLVTAYLEDDTFHYVVTAGLQHHPRAAGAPLLVVFSTLLLIRPPPYPHSFLRRILGQSRIGRAQGSRPYFSLLSGTG